MLQEYLNYLQEKEVPKEVLDNGFDFRWDIKKVWKLKYPTDLMENKKGKLVILDGLHRLCKAVILKHKKINVRIIPRKEIPNIAKD